MKQKQLVFSLILAIVACFAFGWATIIEAHPNYLDPDDQFGFLFRDGFESGTRDDWDG